MLKLLTKGLSSVFGKIARSNSINHAVFESLLKDIRDALLNSDVAPEIAEHLIQRVKNVCIQKNVFAIQKPLDVILQLMKEELIELMGGGAKFDSLINPKGTPFVIIVIGSHGGGKTTTSAKIAHYIKSRENTKILLVSLDLSRPAALHQLRILADSISVDFFNGNFLSQEQICSDALLFAKKNEYSVVIFDTPGCLHTDQEAMKRLVSIKNHTAAKEVLLVIDALIGQNSVKAAKCFADNIGISGVILTKMDSDANGAAALSTKYLTNKLVKFIGVGEGVEDLEPFNAESIALRILDMGDMDALAKKVANVMDDATRENELKKIQSGNFTLKDYALHITKVSKIGGLSKIASMLPGASKLLDSPVFANGNVDKVLLRQLSIINSMTLKEQNNPQILNLSRKKRITAGSGRTVEEINTLLKQFQQMSNLIKSGPGSLSKFSKRFF